MDRRKIAECSTTLLAALDTFKDACGLSHDESIQTVAAAMASMPQGDRELFRRSYDRIEQEMHAHRPA